MCVARSICSNQSATHWTAAIPATAAMSPASAQPATVGMKGRSHRIYAVRASFDVGSDRSNHVALPRLRAVPQEDPIRNVNDDPRMRGPLELLGAFEQRYELLKRARLRLTYENHFAGRLAADDSEQDRPLRSKLLELQGDPPLQRSPPRELPAASEAIRRGMLVLAGEPVETAPTIAGQITEIDRQLVVLGAAITEQRENVDEKLAEVAAEYGRELLPVWNAAVLEMYRAAQELSRSTTRFRELRARCIHAGIRTEILRAPNVSAPLVLGDESDNTSQLSFWRKTLESWGIVP
jgi:hypothetical protein